MCPHGGMAGSAPAPAEPAVVRIPVQVEAHKGLTLKSAQQVQQNRMRKLTVQHVGSEVWLLLWHHKADN